MDWDTHERQQSIVLFAILATISLLLLAFHSRTWVRDLRSVLQWTAGPTHRFLSGWNTTPQEESAPVTGGSVLAAPPPLWAMAPESLRAVQLLREDNRRLREVLDLRGARWPRAVAARVIGRDSQRWFQEIVLDKGRAEGITPDSTVVAVADGREGLVGRVIEVTDHTSKVLLIQDSLSAIAARIIGSASEDGIVEGTNGHDLIFKYIDRSSPIKVGDAVVTAGLGNRVPPEIPVAWVEEISLDPRQLFLQARLRSAVSSNRLRVVLVLVMESES